MKIAHVYDEHYRVSPEKGSVAKFIYNLSTTQSRLGHEVTVLERQWSGLPRQEEQEGVRFTRFPLLIGSDVEGEEIPYKQIRSPVGLLMMLCDRFELALKLRKHFEQANYDVIHFHLPFSANILIHIYPQVRSRMVYTAHVGEENARFGLSSKGVIRILLSKFSPDIHLMRHAAGVSVLNENLRDELPLDNLKVIPNGVDIEEYTPASNSEVDLKSRFGVDEPFVLFVGTITPRKGPDVLLDAIKQLDSAGHLGEMDFVFAGNQEIEPEFVYSLKDDAAGIGRNIVFPGFVSLDELKTLYSLADIFVLPSHEEGWGMAITEAMASGTPVIASRVSGIESQVEDEYNGFLVEPNDPQSLSSALHQLISEPELRDQMAKASRERAVNEFSWESIAESYFTNLYAEVI
jgi:glycosyltransferase involved in cell wall biosynthesis